MSKDPKITIESKEKIDAGCAICVVRLNKKTQYLKKDLHIVGHWYLCGVHYSEWKRNHYFPETTQSDGVSKKQLKEIFAK